MDFKICCGLGKKKKKKKADILTLVSSKDV